MAGNNEGRKPSRMMLRRTLFLMLCFGILVFVVIGIRLFKLQIVDHEFYEEMAIDQQLRSTEIVAHRGTIYDRNGNVLAMSATADTIYISPIEIAIYNEDISLIAQGLSEILDSDYDSIVEKAEDTSSWYKTIAVKVTQDIADEVRNFKNENDLNGVKIETDTKRYYPEGSLAAHIIGFVGTDNSGLGGIESYYNTQLTGINGELVRAKNSAGTDMLFTNFEEYIDATSGDSHVLTIDMGMQYYLEKELSQAIIDYDVQNGAGGIILDVNTGEVLAMASLGSFDLNDYQAVEDEIMQGVLAESDTAIRQELLYEAQLEQWRNKALSDTYEPGSTFKIITLAMALEEGCISASDEFYCGGSTSVLGRTTAVNCWKTTGHGSQTLAQAVQHSCNVAFVNIGQKLGAEAFYDYAESFGLFDKTGIDLYGESGSIWWEESVFCNPDNLSQLAAASFGQTFNITPLQLITAVAACVNGGNLMQPYILKEVYSEEGELVSVTEPTVKRQVISEETSAVVREILEQVVADTTEGTGKNAAVAGYRIGGKTGTSEKVAQDVAGGDKEYIVSFIGVAPADDPEIAVLIFLDTPSDETGIYISGGQMAAPTVGKIFADILPYMGIEPQFSAEEIEAMNRTVPSVISQSKDDAIRSLQNSGLSARVVGVGDTVTAQMPSEGSQIAPNSTVVIYCGEDHSVEKITMPNILGTDFEEAIKTLENSGLFIKRSGAGTIDGTVSAQSIEPNAVVTEGTVIEVTLVDDSDLGRY